VRDIAGRDPSRAPLPWRPPSVAGPGAGFTTGEPWLPLVAGAEVLCVERQAANPASTLSLVRRLARLRAAAPALRVGAQRTLDAANGVLAWMRVSDGDRVLGAMNFTSNPIAAELRGMTGTGTLLVSSDPARSGASIDLPTLTLAPSEALLLRL
jgi:alpha-glucosidase